MVNIVEKSKPTSTYNSPLKISDELRQFTERREQRAKELGIESYVLGADAQSDDELHQDDPNGEVMPVHEHQVDKGQQDEFEGLGPMAAADEKESRACREEPDEAVYPAIVRQIDGKSGETIEQGGGKTSQSMDVFFAEQIKRYNSQDAENER